MKRKGFTLLELIVVMAVVAILVAIAVPWLLNYSKEARLTRYAHDARLVEDAIYRYMMDHDGCAEIGEVFLPESPGSEWVMDKDKNIFEVSSMDGDGSFYRVNLESLRDYVRLREDRKFYVWFDPSEYHCEQDKTVYFPSNEPNVNPEEPEDALPPGGADLSDVIFEEETTDDEVPSDWIPIWDIEDLSLVGSNEYHDGHIFAPGAKYIQMVDLDMAGVTWEPLLGAFNPDWGVNLPALLEGKYNGNGRKILNLTVDAENNGGLFHTIIASEVYNLTFENVDIRVENNEAGVLAGRIESGSTIDQIRVINSVVEGDSTVGGIVGYAGNGFQATRCYFVDGSVSGRDEVGGLLGRLENGSLLINSFAGNCLINSAGAAGGLVGYTGGGCEIMNVSCEGKVAGDELVGGITGAGDNSVVIKNAHFVGEVTGQNMIGGIVGMTMYAQVLDCYVIADVGDSNAESVGGIVGAGGGYGVNGETKIERCYFARFGQKNKVVGGLTYIGGIIGNAWAHLHVLDCETEGSFISYPSSEPNSYVGGIVGMASGDNIRVVGCRSSGSVTGYNYVSGVVGGSWSGLFISDVSSSARVSADGEGGFAAGIVIGEGVVVENASYSGTVTGYRKQPIYFDYTLYREDPDNYGL